MAVDNLHPSAQAARYRNAFNIRPCMIVSPTSPACGGINEVRNVKFFMMKNLKFFIHLPCKGDFQATLGICSAPARSGNDKSSLPPWHVLKPLQAEDNSSDKGTLLEEGFCSTSTGPAREQQMSWGKAGSVIID